MWPPPSELAALPSNPLVGTVVLPSSSPVPDSTQMASLSSNRNEYSTMRAAPASPSARASACTSRHHAPHTSSYELSGAMPLEASCSPRCSPLPAAR